MTQQSNVETAWRPVVLKLISMIVLAALPTTLVAQPQDTDAAENTTQAEPAKGDERGLEDDWETFRPSGMDASFQMPKKPKLRERTFSPVADEPPIKVRLYSSVVQNGNMLFVAGWHDLHSIPKGNRQRNNILEGAVQTSVANVLGSVIEKKNVRLARYPGKRISYRFATGKVLYRCLEHVYLVGARQYQFRMLAKIDQYDGVAADRFLDSVRLLDPDNDLPPRPRNRKKK